MEGLIGIFVSPLVVRARWSGDPDLSALVARVHERLLDAHAHQELPFERLVEELQPERSLSHSPLFQVMFVLQNVRAGQSSARGGLSLSAVPVDRGTAQFDLTLDLAEARAGLVGRFEYDADLFDPTTVSRWARQLESLAAAAVGSPEQPIDTLAALSSAELQQLHVEWNDTRVGVSEDRLLHELVTEQARSCPDTVAVVDTAGALSYDCLMQRVRRTATRLRRERVGPETRVALLCDRSVDMVVAMLAVLEAGGAFVPLDPTHPSVDWS